MDSELDELLISNGILRSYTASELHCVLCETDTNYESYTKHIETSSHEENLQWFEAIFETYDDNVKCAICDKDMQWKDIKVHSSGHMIIPWSECEDSYDKYEIFFANRIFQWDEYFRCALCNITFPSCQVALIHITNPKHQSLKGRLPSVVYSPSKISDWETVVDEGLVILNATELQCKFCKDKSVNISSVERHIQGLMHMSHKSKFSLNLLESASAVPVTTEFMEDSYPEDFAFGEPEAPLFVDRYFSVEVDSPSDSEPNDSQTDFTSPLPLQYPPNTRTLSEKKDFDEASAVVDPNTLQLDYIFKYTVGSSLCIICDCPVEHNAKEQHIKEPTHEVAFKQYGCDAITRKNTTEHYCGYCDCMVSCAQNMFYHVTGKKHMQTVKMIMEERENAAKNVSSDGNPVSVLPEDLPRHYIVPINQTYTQCNVCDVTMIGTLNIQRHINGKLHNRSLKKYGCERIKYRGDDMYDCEWCDMVISHIANVHSHIKKSHHLNSLTVVDERPSENTANSQEDASGIETANEESEKNAPREATDVWLKKIVTSKSSPKKSNNILGINHIIKLPDLTFICRLCDDHIVSPETEETHVAGKRHADALEHYSAEITALIDDKFHCKCCVRTIYGIDNVYLHLHGHRHRKSVNIRELNRARTSDITISSHQVDEGSPSTPSTSHDTATSHPENVGLDTEKEAEKRRSIATTNVASNVEVPREQMDISISSKEDPKKTIPNVQTMKVSSKEGTSGGASGSKPIKEDNSGSSDASGLVCPRLTCNYVTEKPSCSYCEICEVEFTSGINGHVSSSEHSDALKKYGCNNISLMGDHYYCACCELIISRCENVYVHIKERQHLVRKELLISKRQLNAIQKKIEELQTTHAGEQLSSISHTLSDEMSRFVEKLKNNEFEDMDTD